MAGGAGDFDDEREAGACWYVVQTKPRAELKALLNLRQQEFQVFCPCFIKTVRHARKVSKVRTPLFPNYMFLAMDVEQAPWRKINSTYGVTHILMQNERPQPVPKGVVEAIRSQLDIRGKMDWQNAFCIGQDVRIDTGAFANFIGRLEQLDAHGRVRVLLDLMGRKVGVSLHVSEIASGI